MNTPLWFDGAAPVVALWSLPVSSAWALWAARGRWRLVAALGAVLLLGTAAFLANALGGFGGLTAGAAPRVVVQLRALGGFGAGLLLLGVAVARAPGGFAGVLGLGALAFVGWLAPLCSDGLRVAGPGLVWVAGALPWLGIATRRPALAAPMAAWGLALLGLLTGTTAGALGAGLAMLAMGSAGAAARLTEGSWPWRLLLGGAVALPGGLGFAAAVLVVGAGLQSVSPVWFVGPTAVVAGGVLLSTIDIARGPVVPAPITGLGWALLGVSALLGLGGLVGLSPVRATGHALAERLSTPALPADDVRGHRRLWRLQHRAKTVRDAGP
jgi:hypothetical protein